MVLATNTWAAYNFADTDGDGLPDGFEYVVGTSPTRVDSDGDGIPDEAEWQSAHTGSGFDVHAFGDGDHVMLGGVRIASINFLPK